MAVIYERILPNGAKVTIVDDNWRDKTPEEVKQSNEKHWADFWAVVRRGLRCELEGKPY